MQKIRNVEDDAKKQICLVEEGYARSKQQYEESAAVEISSLNKRYKLAEEESSRLIRSMREEQSRLESKLEKFKANEVSLQLAQNQVHAMNENLQEANEKLSFMKIQFMDQMTKMQERAAENEQKLKDDFAREKADMQELTNASKNLFIN